MKQLGRWAVLTTSVIFALAGCGGPGTTVPLGAMTQSRAHSGKSWMLPETSGEDLLYASGPGNDVLVFSYPQGTLVGTIHLPSDVTPFGLCANASGDVFVTAEYAYQGSYVGYIYEYAHGGTQPVETLSEGSWTLPNGCAVDPTTGKLAVTNSFGTQGSYDHGNVAVYENAGGNPTTYYDSNIYWYSWCAYDGAGNLYVDGWNEGGGYPLAELPEGSGSFLNLSVNESLVSESLQWDAGDLVIAGWQWKRRQPTETVYRVQLSGSEGTVVGSTTVRTYTRPRKRRPNLGQYTLYGNTLIGAGFNDPKVHFWRFPEGGLPTRALGSPNGGGFYGVTISVAPSGTRIHRF